MGKKAVNLLLHTVVIIITIMCVVFTGIGLWGAQISPLENSLISLISLALPGFIVMDILFIFYWGLRRRWWVIISLAAVVASYQYMGRIYRIPDNDKMAHHSASDHKILKVATYNIHYFGYDGYINTIKLIGEFLRENEVDVVGFQEFIGWTEYPPDSVAASLGFKYKAIGINSVGSNNTAIFSKYPILDANRIIFKGSPNSALWADIDVNGKPVRVFCAHLQTTSISMERDDVERQFALGTTTDQARALIRITSIMKYNFERRAFQVESLYDIADTTSLPVVICGDMNDTPSSYTYHRFSHRYQDGFMECGAGYGYTFREMKKTLRLDYIFYSDHFRGVKYNSPSVIWSDHNPVLMELEMLD